jgi:hypothetical protein
MNAGGVDNVTAAPDLFAGLIYGAPLETADHSLFTDYIGDGSLQNRETNLRLRESIALMLASPPFQWT